MSIVCHKCDVEFLKAEYDAHSCMKATSSSSGQHEQSMPGSDVVALSPADRYEQKITELEAKKKAVEADKKVVTDQRLGVAAFGLGTLKADALNELLPDDYPEWVEDDRTNIEKISTRINELEVQETNLEAKKRV